MYIYKFEHNNNIYIGSTINLKVRCFAHNQHKKQSRHQNIKLYKYCNENEIIDVRPYITIIETLENNITKDELLLIEQNYLDTIKPNLNMINAKRIIN